LRIAHDEHLAAVMMLPPTDVAPELKKLQAEAQSLKEKAGANVSSQTALSTYFSSWRLKRKIQMLRIIEAVRDYASDHNGKLPESLNEIKEVTIPIDPITNLAFGWKVEGRVATLSAQSLPADVVPQGFEGEVADAMVYRLQVK
jgi:hypothetical protein